MKNERGGIISNLFLIPAGVFLLAAGFVGGYYAGRHQANADARSGTLTPLPEVVAKTIPKPEDFTFYKSLTGKEDKTVSIELKPKAAAEEQQRANIPITRGPSPEKTGQEPVRKPEPAPAKEKVKAQPAAQPAPASRLRYTLQVAAYREKGMAEGDVKKLKQRGYAAFIVSSELAGKGTWYRVRVGSFSNKAGAEKLQKELRSKAGVSPTVMIE